MRKFYVIAGLLIVLTVVLSGCSTPAEQVAPTKEAAATEAQQPTDTPSVEPLTGTVTAAITAAIASGCAMPSMAASRSTRWIRSAPSACQRRATWAGSLS